MQYEQTITLNLNAIGEVAYCLRYADAVAGLGHGEDTAWIGWENTVGDNHDTTVPLPTDVAVPVWFSYYSKGVNLGHVAWNVPGIGFYSSPYSTSKSAEYQQGTTTRAVLPSIAEIERIYGVTYVGWSEYISGEQVIKGESMEQPTPKQVGDIYTAMTGQDISQADLDFYITAPRTVYDLIYALFPATQKARDSITLLEQERDNSLYPYVNAVTAALGLPDTVDPAAAEAAITALKTSGVTKQDVIAYITSNLS